MSKMHRIAACVVAIGGLSAGSSFATVLFHDDFEAQTVGTVVASPPIGSWVEGSGSGANGVAIVGAPALGTKSMRLTRESAPPLGPSNGDISAISLPGAITAGVQTTVKWSYYHQGDHSFNNPMQVSIGHVGSNFNNDSTFIYVADTPHGAYAYYSGPGQFGVNNVSSVLSSRNASSTEGKWDAIRAVFNYTQLSPTQLSGTLDLFISVNGAPEVQIANGALLSTTTIPGTDPTSMQVRFVKGPSSFLDFYDNVSVESVVVPEPASLTLTAALGLLLRRNRR